MVVAIHTVGYCVPLALGQQKLILLIVHTIAVPIFFLVDAFLFSRNILQKNNFNYVTFIRNSAKRLLIPWLIFTVLYTLTRFTFELAGFFDDRLIIGSSWQKIVVSAYGSVYAGQMYFLFSLFLLRLCSPLFKVLAALKSIPLLLAIFLGYFAVYKSFIPFLEPSLGIPGGENPLLLALWGIQFYLVGIVVFKVSQIMDLRKLFVPFLILFAISFLIPESMKLRFNIIQHLYLMTIFLFFAFFQNGVPLLGKIGMNTMGIYLLHQPIVLKSVSMILNKFIPDPLTSYLSILVVTFVLTYFIVTLINHIPYGKFLFGEPNRKVVPSR